MVMVILNLVMVEVAILLVMIMMVKVVCGDGSLWCCSDIMVIELRPGSEMGIAVKGSKSSRQPNFSIVQGILTLLITK